MKAIIIQILRWLTILPASFLASGAAAWLVEFLAGLQYTVNVIGSPTTVEQHFYAIAADFAYGWVFVSAGTATAPSRRAVVAVVLICILFAVMGYVGYHGTLKAGITPLWAALRFAGYIGGGVVAVSLVVANERQTKVEVEHT